MQIRKEYVDLHIVKKQSFKNKYVKFITKNAFIQIALHNDSFCPAAWASFFLIVRNAGRFGSATIIGYIMMMLGKGTIVGLSAFLTVVII